MKWIAALLIAGMLWSSCASKKDLVEHELHNIPVSIVKVDTTFTVDGDTLVKITYEQHRRKQDKREFWAIMGIYAVIIGLAAIQLSQ